jgi:hypothetical protein
MFDGWYGMTDVNSQAEQGNAALRLAELDNEINKYFEGLELAHATGKGGSLSKAERTAILGEEFPHDSVLMQKRAGKMLSEEFMKGRSDDAGEVYSIEEAMLRLWSRYKRHATVRQDGIVQRAINALDIPAYLTVVQEVAT